MQPQSRIAKVRLLCLKCLDTSRYVICMVHYLCDHQVQVSTYLKYLYTAYTTRLTLLQISLKYGNQIAAIKEISKHFH